MCGGRGTRLDADTEKPLYDIDGRPMVDRVIDALRASRIEAIHAVGSSNAPRTRDRLDPGRSDVSRDGTRRCGPHVESFVETPGKGYVTDLAAALDSIDLPVLTVVADLPLLTGESVDRVIDAFEGDSLAVCVPVTLKRALGVSVDTTMEHEGRTVAPTGINVVGTGDAETTLVSHDERLAVNVNRRADAQVAEALA
ncbi:NTP transferase domain-containing protein [Halococcus saccharolyticus]|uniref:GTP:adenosylcobinamide-phosphateguanylyltransfer ase n=1 Tax=Halococcus saccharolyticus DSM 5350 TaxID=1227455 RepID=M0MGJ1_9EURY|nr:NTP transferase domain-containing protein [Halococcus saccharolyticus]EMA44857.1 GTP:adenosylcobinamide-phosphateguanylyltransfer ase [Halococcus saccharolyticus DSM 5350]